MTKKHRLYFLFIRSYYKLLGIKPGVLVKTYSEEKKRYITGVITSVSAESVTKTNLEVDIGIQWSQPLQGDDSRYYSWGSYSKRDFYSKIKFVK